MQSIISINQPLFLVYVFCCRRCITCINCTVYAYSLTMWMGWPIVADSNLLVAETDTEGDVSVPEAEWLSSIRTPLQMSSSRRACLLFDLYLDKDVFHRITFEIIGLHRLVDTELVQKRWLFSISNYEVADHVKDMFEFSLDAAVSRYQVTVRLIISVTSNRGGHISDMPTTLIRYLVKACIGL